MAKYHAGCIDAGMDESTRNHVWKKYGEKNCNENFFFNLLLMGCCIFYPYLSWMGKGWGELICPP